ncbi:MAG: hypothetical protein JWR60_2343 [Polaromonas sp.]|nr:hypothetical protein [Polaromonas sp.]
MTLIKPPAEPVASRSVARLEALTWILVYGGLLTLVLGLFVENVDEAAGWSMVVGGAAVASLGLALIYLRSKIKD